MNESKILRIACDSEWYAHAYSEYMADVAQSVSNLMAAIQDVLNEEDHSSAMVTAMLWNNGVNPDARFILGDYGFSTAREIVDYAWFDTTREEGYVNTRDYTLEEMLSTIRDSWTHCVISSKAFEAYADKDADTVTRVTKFLQDVQSNFQIDDTVRDVVGYYQSMINASPSVESFVDQFLKVIGVDEAESSDNELSYINSDMYKYTGNTPGIALDFSEVNKAVTSTVSVVATTVKGIFNAAVKGVSWLFNKAKKYVMDTVIDPAVCEFIGSDKSNDGYMDGFAWYGQFTPNVEFSHFASGGQISSLFSGFHDSYADKWIKIKLRIGEFLFRCVNDDVTWQCYFKPVAIDVDYLLNNYTGSLSEPNYNYQEHDQSILTYQQWLTSIMAYIQPLSKDASKEQLYRGLACSNALVGSISMFAFLETYALVNGGPSTSSNAGDSYLSTLSNYATFDPALSSNAVTNQKILAAAAGDPSSSSNIENYIMWNDTIGVTISDSVPAYSMQTVMTDIISIWAMCRNERKLSPTNYTFVPYSNNHTGFSPASWRIKTDDDIADTRDTFIERLILAIVIVTAVVFIGAAVIKTSKKFFFKRQQKLSELDNKMWSGQKLTSAERRQYLRYSRKQNASRWLSTGTGTFNYSLSNDNLRIIELIQG